MEQQRKEVILIKPISVNKVKQIISTICLLNSMVICGEEHSETSQGMMKEALENLNSLMKE